MDSDVDPWCLIRLSDAGIHSFLAGRWKDSPDAWRDALGGNLVPITAERAAEIERLMTEQDRISA